MWPSCNIGAEKPEDYGNYYAWGEVLPKEDYSWETYKYANGAFDKLTKYCNKKSYGDNGFTDNKTTLAPKDDAAHVNWGGSWRMPTDAEWQELQDNCTWTWIWATQNGIQIWVSDITYIKVWDDKAHTQYHFCYLSLITDAYSKMVKGYTVSETMETIHPLSALQMALKSQPKDFDFSGLTHHSDRGVQYASAQYVQLLKKHNITISMTEDGNPKHNAIAERINNTIKNEFFAKLSFESIEEVRANVREAVAFYNQRRPHMSINGLTPAEAEEQVGEIKKQWYSYREQAIKGLAM